MITLSIKKLTIFAPVTKKIRIKLSRAYIAAILCFMVPMPTMIEGISSLPRYIQYFQQPHGKNYVLNCRFIDMNQVIRGLGLLAYYRTTHKKKNLDQAISVIQDQLKEFEVWLLQEEQDALIALKNRYSLSDEVWDACLTDMHELKNIYKEAMQQAWHETDHDENVSPDLLQALTSMLQKNSINPQSITIKMVDNQEAKIQMQVRSAIETMIDSTDNRLIVTKQYRPLIIEVCSGLYDNKDPQKLVAMCAHEIQHIMQHHGLTDVIVRAYLKHYCALDNATLICSPEYQRLAQIHEAQAEILSAIKNPEIAYALNAYRAHKYYPNYLYEEHYYNLSDINMLWKLDAWLTWCGQQGVINKKYDIMTKMHNLADSFKQLIS